MDIADPQDKYRRPIRAHIPQALPGMDLHITASDLALWVEAIAPHISPERRARYIDSYGVADKVRHAMLDGSWPDVKARALQSLSENGMRLSLALIAAATLAGCSTTYISPTQSHWPKTTTRPALASEVPNRTLTPEILSAQKIASARSD